MNYDVSIFREAGRAAALKLREVANNMTGTEIIAQERDIPLFDSKKDYTGWPVGSPVADEGQIWLLLQPYNAANHAGRPSNLRALWGLAHTTNPAHARPWVAPYGTSGMYMKGECYIDGNGKVKRALQDNLVWDAEAYPQGWEDVQ